MDLQGCCGHSTSVFGLFRIACSRSQIAQDRRPSLTQYRFRDLVHRGKHASDTARHRLIGYGTVCDCEMRLLSVTGAVDFQLDILTPRSRAAIEWGIDQRLKNIPNLGPAVADGPY